MPKGVNFLSGLKSWSAALMVTRVLPPLEKFPNNTVALASSEIRRMVSSSSASLCSLASWSKIASVSGSFFGGGFSARSVACTPGH